MITDLAYMYYVVPLGHHVIFFYSFQYTFCSPNRERAITTWSRCRYRLPSVNPTDLLLVIYGSPIMRRLPFKFQYRFYFSTGAFGHENWLYLW